MKIPEARLAVPTGTRLWIVVASMVLLIGFIFPIYFIAIIKRSYDVKFGWEQAISEAERLVGAGGGATGSANATASELLA